MESDLAIRLKRWRVNHALSQQKLADYLGVSRQAVYLWERGGSFGHEQLLRLALQHYDCKKETQS